MAEGKMAAGPAVQLVAGAACVRAADSTCMGLLGPVCARSVPHPRPRTWCTARCPAAAPRPPPAAPQRARRATRSTWGRRRRLSPMTAQWWRRWTRTRPRCAGTGRVRANTTAAGRRGGPGPLRPGPASRRCVAAGRAPTQPAHDCGPLLLLSTTLPLSLLVYFWQTDHFLESTYGNLHFAKKVNAVGISNVLGLRRVEDIIDTPYSMLKASGRSLGVAGGVRQRGGVHQPDLWARATGIRTCALAWPRAHSRRTSRHTPCLHQPPHALRRPCPAPTQERTEQLMRELEVQPSSYPECLPQRGIYCSRTLNLRSIQARPDCASQRLVWWGGTQASLAGAVASALPGFWLPH